MIRLLFEDFSPQANRFLFLALLQSLGRLGLEHGDVRHTLGRLLHKCFRDGVMN